ncbi:hypothetical protein DUI87_10197 [Hirundo rustica rustica]|uniref:Uncharacterized protein n=1 Tax=Hirundo rustica rustica TaxID=333673 RepID=A0A3M0KHP6_HIRRU|nr:hypothetical protein DUI87_10197 [Hirundo rustica rustica]
MEKLRRVLAGQDDEEQGLTAQKQADKQYSKKVEQKRFGDAILHIAVLGNDLVSLLNDRHRYDDEEYEEEEAGAAADEGLVRKCTEWLRGVESAAGRDHPDRLETLPHLGTL